MTHGRKISDDELVEISGGMDGLTEIDLGQMTESDPGSRSREDDPPGGGGIGVETEDMSGGTDELGPGS